MSHGIHLINEHPKKAFKKRIIDKFGGECAYCGSPFRLTVDHVIPKFHNGQTVESNLAAACEPCNRKKGSQELYSWWVESGHYTPERDRLLQQRLGIARSA